VVDQLLGVGAGAVHEGDDGDDLLPPPLAGSAGDHDVGHRRVRQQRGLDLLDEDLLSAGVDGLRLAAE